MSDYSFKHALDTVELLCKVVMTINGRRLCSERIQFQCCHIISYTIMFLKREAFLFAFPLCLPKSQPEADQLAESSSLKQGDRLQK